MTRRPDLRAVDLVEADAAAAPGGGPEPGRRQPGTRRRRALRGAAVVTLGVLALAGVHVGADRREAARVAALAGAPGVVSTPVGSPVEVRWRPRQVPVAGLRTVGGLVLGPAPSPDGGVDAVAIDRVTGQRMWRVRLAGSAAGATPAARCEAPDPPPSPADDPVLVCVVADDTDTAAPAGLGTATYATRARLVVLDAVTGRTLADRRIPPSTTLTALGPDVLLAHADDAGRATVRRVAPRDGTVRWRFRAPGPGVVGDVGRPRLVVQTDGDLVLVDTGRSWVLGAGTGEVLRGWPAARCPDAVERGVGLLPGRGAVFRPSGDAAGAVVDVRTGRSSAVDGPPATVGADDGSLPDLVVVERADRRVRTAHDLRSGRVLWTSSQVPTGPTLVLDGRLVAIHDGEVRAVDGRTGAPVWTARLGPGRARSLATDGRVVLVTTRHGAGRATVSAVGLDDGRRRWSAGLDDDVHLWTVDGALYGVAEDGPVALGARSGRARPPAPRAVTVSRGPAAGRPGPRRPAG